MISGRPSTHAKGFTLVEIAVVLVIIAFLTGGALVAMRVQAQRSAFATTQAALEEAKDALLGFAIGNKGKLPCPAPDASGISASSCSTGSARRGVLPWRTLGIAGIDAWNQYLSYEVTATYTYVDSITNTLADPSQTSNLGVSLCKTRNGERITDMNSVALAIWSHGANGHNAFSAQGGFQGPSDDSDERSNSPIDPPTPLQIVSHPHSDTYDDQILWVSKFIWRKRLLDIEILPPPIVEGSGNDCPTP